MNLTTIVGGIAVVIIGYFVFFKRKSADTAPTETTTATEGTVDTPKAPS